MSKFVNVLRPADYRSIQETLIKEAKERAQRTLGQHYGLTSFPIGADAARSSGPASPKMARRARAAATPSPAARHGNDVRGYDMVLAMTQQAINNQLEYIYNEFQLGQEQVTVTLRPDRRVPSLEIRRLGIPSVRLNTVRAGATVDLHLPIDSGVFHGLDDDFEAVELPVDGFEIIITTNLRQEAARDLGEGLATTSDGTRLKLGADSIAEVREIVGDIDEASLSVEHLFIDLTNARLVGEMHMVQANVSPELAEKLRDWRIGEQLNRLLATYLVELKKKDNPFVLGHIATEIQGDVVAGTPDETTFPITSIRHSLTPHALSPERATLNYLMMSGRQPPTANDAGIFPHPLVDRPEGEEQPRGTFLLSQQLTLAPIMAVIAGQLGANLITHPPIQEGRNLRISFPYQLPIFQLDQQRNVMLDANGRPVLDRHISGTFNVTLKPKVGVSSMMAEVDGKSAEYPAARLDIDFHFVSDLKQVRFWWVNMDSFRLNVSWTTSCGFALLDGARGTIVPARVTTSEAKVFQTDENHHVAERVLAVVAALFVSIITLGLAAPAVIGGVIATAIEAGILAGRQDQMGRSAGLDGTALFNWGNRLILPGVDIVRYKRIRFDDDGHLAMDVSYSQ